MGHIKLTEPGQSHVLFVKSVTLNSSGNWPDFDFSDGTDTLSVPAKALERQLSRLKVQAADQLVGAWVKFSRSDKPGSNGKLFWNVDLAAITERAQPTADRVTSPYREPAKPQPFDEPTDDERFAEFSAAVDSLRPEREVPPPLADTAEARYFALFERVAAHQARIGKLHGFPIDGSSVQAMTFSIFKA